MQLPIQQSTVTTVPFHGTNLFVVEHEGQPYAPMRPIVEGMGLDWKSQHVKLQSGRFETCVVEITTQIPGDDQRRAVTCLPLRKLMGWLMSIHPNKVRSEIRDKVIAYQSECDDVLWNYWTKGSATNARVAQQPVDQNTALTLSHKQVKDLEAIFNHAEMVFGPQEDGIDQDFINGKLNILKGLVQSALHPQTNLPESKNAADPREGTTWMFNNLPVAQLNGELYVGAAALCRETGMSFKVQQATKLYRQQGVRVKAQSRSGVRELTMLPLTGLEQKLQHRRLDRSVKDRLGESIKLLRSANGLTLH